VAREAAWTLHQQYQRNRQEGYEHHQLEIVDEGDGFRLGAFGFAK
jgi:hypothetical protein